MESGPEDFTMSLFLVSPVGAGRDPGVLTPDRPSLRSQWELPGTTNGSDV